MSYSSEVLADSPTAYWPMTETSGNIADSVGGVILTANGSSIYSVPNYVNTSINYLGGAANYHSKASPGVAFKWTLGADLTIEFCAKRNTVDATLRTVLTCRTDFSTNRQFAVFHSAAGNVILFDLGGTGNRWTTTTKINDTIWHHIVLKHRGSDGHRELWIDGHVKETTTQLPTTADATVGPLSIGGNSSSTSIDSCLSDVAIYNGIYLSDARCVAHWLQIQNRNSSFLAESL